VDRPRVDPHEKILFTTAPLPRNSVSLAVDQRIASNAALPAKTLFDLVQGRDLQVSRRRVPRIEYPIAA